MMRLFSRTRRTLFSTLLLLSFSTLTISCSIPEEPVVSGSGDAVEETSVSDAEVTLMGPGQILPVSAIAQINGETFELEVAQTRQEQALGLMFRNALPDNRGMLFPFDRPRRASFWMKDVPVALDMVFIRDSAVIYVASEVPPCPETPCPSYGPGAEIVDQVLELRSGRAAEINLQPGDAVMIQPLDQTAAESE
ncbi:MAG: DUF192 domain-containing protein [Cyanobacteria bacterium J06627_28]